MREHDFEAVDAVTAQHRLTPRTTSTYGAGELVVGAGRDGVLFAGREGAGAVLAGCDGVSHTTGADCCGAGGGEGGGGGGLTRAGGGGGLDARRCGLGAGGLVARGAGELEFDRGDVRAGVEEDPEALERGAGGEAARRSRRVDERLRDSDLAGFFAAGFVEAVSAVSFVLGDFGALPKSPIEGAPTAPPTDSVCERPTSATTAAAPPTASVVAALAPNSCVRALRATRRCRRAARTRTSSGSQAGGGENSGSALVSGSGDATHFSNSACSGLTGAGVTAREPGTPARRDGVTAGDSDGAGRVAAGLGFGGAAAGRGGALRSTSATLTGAGGDSAGASATSSSRSTRRMMRRGGQTPVRRDSSSSSLMFTLDRPVRLPAAKP